LDATLTQKHAISRQLIKKKQQSYIVDFNDKIVARLSTASHQGFCREWDQ
jgi:hypothetical protein